MLNTKNSSLPLLFSLTMLAGCGHSSHDEMGHSEASALEIRLAADPTVLIAQWSEDEGFRDANDTAIDTLPPPVWDEDTLVPLRAGGPSTRLLLQWSEPDGHEIDMTAIAEDGATGERQCGESSTRYYPLDDETTNIAWPNVAHPDGPEGATQFAQVEGGDLVPIFHCDAVTIVPEVAGTFELAFVVWHGGHADVETTPIQVVVDP